MQGLQRGLMARHDQGAGRHRWTGPRDRLGLVGARGVETMAVVGHQEGGRIGTGQEGPTGIEGPGGVQGQAGRALASLRRASRMAGGRGGGWQRRQAWQGRWSCGSKGGVGQCRQGSNQGDAGRRGSPQEKDTTKGDTIQANPSPMATLRASERVREHVAGAMLTPAVWRVRQDPRLHPETAVMATPAPDALVAALAEASHEFDATHADPERNCWLAVHRHTHGALPTEYDIREIDEELYLAVLARRKAQAG